MSGRYEVWPYRSHPGCQWEPPYSEEMPDLDWSTDDPDEAANYAYSITNGYNGVYCVIFDTLTSEQFTDNTEGFLRADRP